MRLGRLLPLAVALVAIPLLAPGVTWGQRGARSAPAMSARRGSMAARSTPMRPTHQNTPRFNNSGFNNGFLGNGFFGSGFASNALGLGNVSFFPNTNYGVGMNGINFVATQDIGTLAAIDPATQWRLAIAERVAQSTPGLFSGAGFYLLGGGGYAVPEEPATGNEQGPQQQQAPIIVMQQPAAQQAPAPAAQEPPPAPLPDAGQFTLVLRDGTQIQALAFTHMKDRIVYITQEGGRRTIPFTDLDADATVRVNQERGTPLQLPL